jgi:hypothetical protein
VSFTGYSNLLKAKHPALFAELEDITAPIATLPTMLLGRPVIAAVSSPTPVLLPPVNYLSFEQGDASTSLGEGPVTLTIMSPRSEDVELSAEASPFTSAARVGPLTLVASSSGRVASVAATPGPVLLPLHLHWGLNRVHVNVIGAAVAGPVVYLSRIALRQR